MTSVAIDLYRIPTIHRPYIVILEAIDKGFLFSRELFHVDFILEICLNICEDPSYCCRPSAFNLNTIHSSFAESFVLLKFTTQVFT